MGGPQNQNSPPGGRVLSPGLLGAPKFFPFFNGGARNPPTPPVWGGGGNPGFPPSPKPQSGGQKGRKPPASPCGGRGGKDGGAPFSGLGGARPGRLGVFLGRPRPPLSSAGTPTRDGGGVFPFGGNGPLVFGGAPPQKPPPAPPVSVPPPGGGPAAAGVFPPLVDTVDREKSRGENGSPGPPGKNPAYPRRALRGNFPSTWAKKPPLPPKKKFLKNLFWGGKFWEIFPLGPPDFPAPPKKPFGASPGVPPPSANNPEVRGV